MRVLFFVAYNPEELACTPDYEPAFKPGDLLLERSTVYEGDGLIVQKWGSRVVDMVWPEEVDASA